MLIAKERTWLEHHLSRTCNIYEFNGQMTDPLFSLPEKKHICYVTVPPNYSDILQLPDVSVNKPAKEFVHACFQSWYVFEELMFW